MFKRYYLDTSIWLDIFEDRDEPSLPKSTWAKLLIKKIIREDARIVVSDHVIIELGFSGYSLYEVNDHFQSFERIIMQVESSDKELSRANDLARKRGVPMGDALHALVARREHAVLVSLDHDFKELVDITVAHRTNELL